MKLKKAKKMEASLVVVLEFVRVMASTNPTATGETLQKMGITENIFAPCVNRLVKLALKNAKAAGAEIYDILNTLRKESKRLKRDEERENVYEEQETEDDETV